MATTLNRTERERLLNCGICDRRLTEPRLLDCLHSFCTECLVIKQEQTSSKDVVVCELCGNHTSLLNQSIDSLTPNTFIINIGKVDEILHSNRHFCCSFCEEHGKSEEASSLCLTCGDWLCLTCSERHCGTRITRNHKVVSINDVREDPKYSSELRKLHETKCAQHDEKIIEFCLQCRTPVCFECFQTTHKQHESVPLKDSASKVQENLSNLLQMFESIVEVDEEFEKQIAKRLQEVKNKERSLLQLVEETRDRLIQEIQQQATAAELALSHPFEVVKLSLSEVLKSVHKRSESTQRSRLFCEILLHQGLAEESVHFRELLQRVKSAGCRREKMEFPSIPVLKLDISDFLIPKIFAVQEENKKDNSQQTDEIGNQKTARLVGEKDILIPIGGFPDRSISKTRENIESPIPNADENAEKQTEEKIEKKTPVEEGASGFDFMLYDSDSDEEITDDDDDKDESKINVLLPTEPVKAEKKAEPSGDDIIRTIKVKDYSYVPLSIGSDKAPTVVHDICWLTDSAFAVGDQANHRIKVFDDKGLCLWFKDLQEGSIERIACIDGVIASDYSSGVHLETRYESFTKIYCYTPTRTHPYPIVKTSRKDVVIGNRDFTDLRCYSTKGKRIRYIPIGRKVDINYIAQNKMQDFIWTEKRSNSVTRFHEGQKMSVLYKGLPHWKPEGVATDSDDNVYVSDRTGGSIVKLSPRGDLLGILEVHPPGPRGLSISSRNQLVVSDDEGNAWIMWL
ncbi:E3 ubiquitin-protein ligase TRIM56-like [Saccostrea echinata]|uniref:E3 ubiquitin-protein ligase TRIM56-like n=1 Tax=Saccostrea echinata TaxID=191078 RepID=UPI002A82F404|nr:E3 ubiquitin-protein ligase TRIM56-like [Saccostrea echinata]